MKRSTPLLMPLLMHFLSMAMIADVGAAESTTLARASAPDGRIRVRLSTSPGRPKLSDTIFLTLVVETDPTLDVELPDFGSALGDLKILDMTRTVSGAGTETEKTLLVLKTLPAKGGETPIWPMTIRYRDRREGLRDTFHSLELPMSRLVVDAEVTPENASLDKIPTSRTLIDMDGRNRNLLFAAGLILLAVVAFLLLRRRRKTEEVAVVSNLTLREIAIERLDDLVARRLHETDVKRFFIELTGIVRWYIEQQTHVRAPELTTEEFLREISSRWKNREIFPGELQDRLRLFLESADMVKFAKFQPSQDEIMLGFRRAREFVAAFVPRRSPETSLEDQT